MSRESYHLIMKWLTYSTHKHLQGVKKSIHFSIGNMFVNPGDTTHNINNTFNNNNVIVICAMLRIFTLHWLCVVNLDCFKSISLHNIPRDAHSPCRGHRAPMN